MLHIDRLWPLSLTLEKEKPVRGKHSNFLRTLVNYGRQKLYNIWPRIGSAILRVMDPYWGRV
jgi:hypothetical protein